MAQIEPPIQCRQCGYSLMNLDESRCPECGREFDLKDPATYKSELTEPVKLCPCRDEMEAQFLCSLLEQENIRAVVMGGVLSTARGDLPMTAETLPAVWINASNADAAMIIVKELEQSIRGKSQSTADPWICPSCNEKIEGQFSTCWNCQTDKPADPDSN